MFYTGNVAGAYSLPNNISLKGFVVVCFSFVLFLLFETGSHSVDQAGLKLSEIHLAVPTELNLGS